MGAFTLTNGALLTGLALLVAPIVAHLLQRKARKPVIFPSIAFLQAAAAQQSHLHTLRRLILLLLRLLAVTAVVLAFTRPMWWNNVGRGAEQRSATATVLVIDASLSTTQTVHGSQLFDELKAAGARLLGELRTGVDVASVVWAGQDAESVFPRLTANLPELRNDLLKGEPTFGRANFPAAFNVASQQLGAHSGPRRIVILTDRQATNWKQADRSSDAEFQLPSGITVEVPEFDVAEGPNLALLQPVLSPEHPRPGASASASVAVRSDAEATRSVQVSGTWVGSADSEFGDAQSAEIRSRDASTLTWQVTVPMERVPAIQWKISEIDALPADNVAWLSVRPKSGTPVLVVSDDSPDEPGTAAFYLMRALAPFDRDSGNTSAFTPRHLKPSQLTDTDLRASRLVFLGYCGILKSETTALLSEFVRNGGSLVLFAGDGPVDQNVRNLDEASGQSMFPWQLLTRRSAARRQPIVLGSGAWFSRWLREFDVTSQVALRDLAFQKAWTATPPAAGTEVLLRFTENEPAVGVRSFGSGQTLLLNISPESTSGDFGKTGTFVALVQMFASALIEDDVHRPVAEVGDQLSFAMPQNSSGPFVILGPDNEVLSEAEADGTSGALPPILAKKPGLYRLSAKDRDVEIMAVNLSPLESDLRPLPVEELRQLIQRSDRLPGLTTQPGAARRTEALNAGQPLWGSMLLVGLSVIGLEMLLLGIWRR